VTAAFHPQPILWDLKVPFVLHRETKLATYPIINVADGWFLKDKPRRTPKIVRTFVYAHELTEKQWLK